MIRRFLYAFLAAATSWPVASAWCQPVVERVPRDPLGFRLVKTPGIPRGVSVWYPAAGGTSAATMTAADYLNADVDSNAAARTQFMTGIARNYGGAIGLPSGPRPPDLPDSVARAALAVRGTAVRNAPQKAGNHALVVFTIPLGGTGAADQFLLAEALAARGVIVVSGPPLGSVPDGTAADDFMDLLKQSATRALDVGLALPGVDSSRVIAFDVTGSTALVMQLERPRFAAAVAFDEMPFTDRHRIAVEGSAATLRLRVLYFPLGAPAPNAALFNKLPRVTAVELPGASHGLMSAWGTHFKRQLRGDTRLYDTALSRILTFIDSVKEP